MKKGLKIGCGCVCAVLIGFALPVGLFIISVFHEERDNSKFGHENWVYKENVITPEEAMKKIPLSFPEYSEMGTEEKDVNGNVMTGPLALITTLKFQSTPEETTLSEIKNVWKEVEDGLYHYISNDSSFMCRYNFKDNTIQIYREWYPFK